jgi:hypothetical protein
MTPEGRIKRKINLLLATYGDDVYYFMPVPGGYGRRTVDYLGCVRGVFFAIEAKRPRAKPTPLQTGTLEQVSAANGNSFVVNDEASLGVFKKFLDYVMEIT